MNKTKTTKNSRQNKQTNKNPQQSSPKKQGSMVICFIDTTLSFKQIGQQIQNSTTSLHWKYFCFEVERKTISLSRETEKNFFFSLYFFFPPGDNFLPHSASKEYIPDQTDQPKQAMVPAHLSTFITWSVKFENRCLYRVCSF